jgi:DNA-binding response OmpR family regulator
MRILLVEDDVDLSETVVEVLTDQNYVVDAVKSAEIAWEYVQVYPYSAILLDVTLPGMSGVHFCEQLRKKGYTLPVLIMTARDTTSDKVIGLDAGADVYLVKPVNLQELLAQLRSSLRRSGIGGGQLLQWGSLKLDLSSFEATYGDQTLHLTPKEYALMELLMRNGRRVLSRSVMIDHLWPTDEAPGEEAVKAHLKGLRAKLKRASAPEDLIETVHGVGYRLKQVDVLR